MKNFLTTLCALGAAIFTATSFALTGSENFEGYSTGALNITSGSTTDWASNEADDTGSMGDAAVVTAYEEGVKKPSSTTAGGKNYLKLETSETLERYVTSSGTTTDIGNGLYFDGQVQFTACDEEPTITLSETNPEKLIVYLRANEVTGDDGTVTSATTNFVVVAGYYNARGTSTKTSYVCDVPSTYDYDPTAWHRLVVKSYKLGEDNAYFKVFVDDTALSTASGVKKGDENSKTADFAADAFPSLDTSSEDATKLTSIGFKGTGAIDEIAWLDSDPLTVTVKKAYVWENGTLSLTVNGETKDVVSGTAYDFNETDIIVVNFEADETHAFDASTDEPTVETKDGVTTYTYKPVEAAATVTIGDKVKGVKDFAAAVALANASESKATVKLLKDSSVDSGSEEESVDFDSTTTLVLNNCTLTVTGAGLYGNDGLTIWGKGGPEVGSLEGEIVAKEICDYVSLSINGGKFKCESAPYAYVNEQTVAAVVPDNYTLQKVGEYWQLVANGGSTDPTVDGGDTDTKIDPENKTITVNSSESGELKIEGDASAYTINVPQNVTTITGTINTENLHIKYTDATTTTTTDITGAFSVTTAEGVTTIALNPEGKVTVNDVEISVTPALADKTDDVKPFAVASGSVSATVKAIPGLTYQLLGSETVQAADQFDYANPVASAQADTTGTVTLTDESATAAAKFYTIRVTR